jgi:hypothetical protein
LRLVVLKPSHFFKLQPATPCKTITTQEAANPKVGEFEPSDLLVLFPRWSGLELMRSALDESIREHCICLDTHLCRPLLSIQRMHACHIEQFCE